MCEWGGGVEGKCEWGGVSGLNTFSWFRPCLPIQWTLDKREQGIL